MPDNWGEGRIDQQEEGSLVAELAQALRTTQFPPELLKKLGLPPDWASRVPDSFVSHLAELIVKYRETLAELAKH